MTQASSFKENLKNAFSIFKWETKNRATSLAVYGILSASLTAVIFTLCMSVGVNPEEQLPFQKAALAFQLIASSIVFTLTVVFTIIYTAGNYSYLHNKRKVDMYGSLPISSAGLYLSKTVSAFLFSLVPALFFFGIISVTSILMGQPLVTETIELYVHVIIGTMACVAFYGFLAVCCGTTIHTIISFLAICISYPIASNLVKGVIKAFYYGLPAGVNKNHFLLNALNPIEAYQGKNVIYWILFTALCLVLGTLLSKKRRSDRAQNSFAYYLPAYIVKLIVAFICGMLLGILFGSINVLGNGLLGFAFGFLLGAIPAYVIVHLIFYLNFDRLIKTSIPFAAMVFLVFAAIIVCNFDVLGYNKYIPNLEDVESAGFVYTSDVLDGGKTVRIIADECADDYSDTDDIQKVLDVHRETLYDLNFSSQAKFANVWYHVFFDGIEEVVGSESSYCVGYRMKSGGIVTRYYREYQLVIGSKMQNSNTRSKLIDEITESNKYYDIYYSIDTVSPEMLQKISVRGNVNLSGEECVVAENNRVSAQQARADSLRIYEAMKKDRIHFSKSSSDFSDSKKGAVIYYESQNRVQTSRLLHTLMRLSDYQSKKVSITEDDVNTVQVLREIGVYDSSGKLNKNSPYYKFEDQEFTH